MKHLLIVGRPGIGKTTLMKRLIEPLRNRPIDGFVTEEYRDDGSRVGFWLSPLDGRQMLLAHRDLTTGIRVGPYKVNTAVLEEFAIPVIQRARGSACILFLDELGRMELSSPRFSQAVQDAFDRGPVIVATASLAPIPLLNALKQRRDVELIPLTVSNRASIEEELSARFQVLCSEDGAVHKLQQRANRICELIIADQAPLLDIEIQQAALQESVRQAFPEKPQWYRLVYETRFRRLWQQFRHEHS